MQVVRKLSQQPAYKALVESSYSRAGKSILVKEYFTQLIEGGTLSSQIRTPTRHLTIETINRYIFTLNEV